MNTPVDPRPLVTIIVPGRDVAGFATEALASLRAQTFAAWRAILVAGSWIRRRATICRSR